MSTSAPLRVGVIGLGMGRVHVQGFRAHPRASVVAVCDADASRVEAVRRDFAVPAGYAEAEAMLERESLDVVAIATPNRLHRPLTLAALARGAHVLCEKPIGMDAAEGREMVAAAARAGRRLMVNFSFRFRPQSQILHRLARSGMLGDIHHARSVWLRRHGFPGFGGWFTDRAQSGGGPLIDLGVHRIDLALWLMGFPRATWVMGATSDALTREESERQGRPASVEHHATGLIRFATGATLQVDAGWALHQGPAEIMETHLHGTRAGLSQRNDGQGHVFTAEIHERRPGGHFTATLAKAEESERSAMEHFIDAIVGDLPTPAPGEEAVQVQAIIDALYASAASGAPVRLDP